jgi:hypothetical protein
MWERGCFTPGLRNEGASLAVLLLVLLTQASVPPSVHAQAGSSGVILGISVYVSDAATSLPLSHARVELQSRNGPVVAEGYTDDRGCAEFLGVLPQPYLVRASLDGYETTETQLDVKPGESHREVDVVLGRAKEDRPRGAAGTVTAHLLAVPKRAARELQKGLVCLNTERKPEESIRHFRKATRLFAGFYEAHFLMGMAYLELNSQEEAIEAFREALRLNSQFLQAYRPLALLLLAQRQYEESDRLLLKAVELDPQGWQWPFELARSYAQQRQWDLAFYYGYMACHRPRAPAKVHLLMVDLYRNTGDDMDALDELEEFKKADPGSPLIPRVEQTILELRAHAARRQ